MLGRCGQDEARRSDGNAVVGYPGEVLGNSYYTCAALKTKTTQWLDIFLLGTWNARPIVYPSTYGADAIPTADGAVLRRDGTLVSKGTVRTGFVSLGRWGVADADVPVAISGTSETDLWVSGTFGGTTGLASHRDANGWTYGVLPAKPTSPVHAMSPTSAWVAMGDRAAYFDGTSWIEKGVATGASSTWTRIWGNGPNEAWALREGIAYHSSVLYRWNGATWTMMTAPAFTLGPSPSGSVRLVSYSGGISDWNGTKFVTVSSPPVLNGKPVLIGAASFVSPSEIWMRRAGVVLEPRVVHWKDGCARFLDAGMGLIDSSLDTTIAAANHRVILGALAETTY